MRTLWIVESLTAVSHTFLRADMARRGSATDANVAEVGEIWRTAKVGVKLLVPIGRLLAFVLVNPTVLLLLANRRALSNVKALSILVLILGEKSLIDDAAAVRAHFLGKCGVVGVLLGRILGRPCTVVCHASDLYDLPRSMNCLLKWATRLEVVTHFGRGFVYGRLGKDGIGKVDLRRNCVQVVCKPSVAHVPDATVLRLVSVARLATQKDLAFAIDVVHEIKKRSEAIRPIYEIIGDGPELGNLRERCKALGLLENVVFHGAVGNEAIWPFFDRADAFILPCRGDNLADADGLPVAFQESLLSGCPVFCRDIFGIAELLINGVNGFALPLSLSPIVWADLLITRAKVFDRRLISKLASMQFDVLETGRAD